MGIPAEDLYRYDDEFRNKISTVDSEGKRVWIYPKKPEGSYHKARITVAILLLFLLFIGPFIQVDGHPFMLFNIIERRFIIFGIPFWPQDFHLFVLGLISFIVFIVLFTVIYGRVWCGWACPQTIFMEMVFRKIEYLIEGDVGRQRKLDDMPWNIEKMTKKITKHVVFFLIALVIAHLLMTYLIGFDQVKEIVSQSPMEHQGGFMGLLFFTGLFYFIFAFFREQACIAVCPYGRLQGVFLGKNSIAVMYDWLRGEPRSRLKKNQPTQDAGKGDCIDCKMCVHVCPTGIDIRNGTQLECVNCTACIDACNDVMEKINKPSGLIRYASVNSISEGQKNLLTSRVAGYSFVLILLLSLLVYLLISRTPIETIALRVPGMLFQEQENDRISNLYNIQFVNKTFEDKNIHIRLKNYEEGTIRKVGSEIIHIPSNSVVEGVFFIELPKSVIVQSKTSLVIEVIDDGEVIDEVITNFLGPIKKP